MLPEKLPDARVFTYDWHADTVGDSIEDTLSGHAMTLVRGLGKRVSHSFTGEFPLDL